MKEEIEFYDGVVLCPKCNTGKIKSAKVSIFAFSKTGHLQAHMYMTCPDCGEQLLSEGDSVEITYKFNFDERSCHKTGITILSDDSKELDEPKNGEL